ncbi:head-tail connector protein [Peribacillus asahii]|uniref:head-tail connector protein n=1 Tax=Peribacillus asahii TaxID=228899 RepID=UPI00207AFC5D|nr:head-tail connector protein [Peribacillus asahii]USK61335.1 head-tail connector protein [Peribacillus asahii]
MKLEDLKTRLKITDSSQDDYLKIALEDAIDYVKTYCNNPFTDSFPGGVKKAIALIVKSMGESSNVQSQSLGDMEKSFFEGGTMNEAHRYLEPYCVKKVKFL